MRKIIYSGFLFSIFFVSSFLPDKCKAQAAVFEVEYLGLSLEAQTAFQFAADIWSNYLISDVPIKIVAHMQPLLPGQLGITFPNGEINFTDAPVSNVWYASCLANAISGVEINGDDADIEIYFSSLVSWYYGLDANPGPSQYDFVSTVLHEICHGLGFLSLSNKQGAEGSFGIITADAFAPLTTTFTWPELDTLPSIFDVYIENMAGNVLLSLENPSDALGTELVSNQLYFNSPEIISETGGIRPKIYAPASFTLGSSLSHWDEASYPVGHENEFMTPQAANGHAGHAPGILTLTVLEEIGWEINYDTAQMNIQNDYVHSLKLYPNPCNEILFIEHQNSSCTFVEIYNVSGEIIFRSEYAEENISVNTQTFLPGIYLVKIENSLGTFYRSLVKI